MGIAAIRDGIGANLAAIAGLAIHGEAPAQIQATPAAIVLPTAGGSYDYVGGGAAVRHLVTVTVLVSLGGGHERAQREMDDFIAPTGPRSIKAAIQAEPTLGGAAQDVRVARYYDYGGRDYAGRQFLGVAFEVEVYE